MPAAPSENIELLPKEDWEKTSFGKMLRWALGVGRYIVIATELVVVIAFLARFKFDRDLTDLYEEINQKKIIIENSADFENDFLFLQKKLAVVEEIENQHAASAKVIEDLNGLLPLDVSLKKLAVKKDIISLGAIALSEEGFASLLKNLETSELFEKPKVISVGSEMPTETGIEFELESRYLTKES